MVAHEFIPMTLEEIRQENERIERATIREALPVPAPKIPAERRIATLRDKLRTFKFTAAPDVPVVLEDAKPECPVCNGTGAIKYELPVGHPLFGKLQKCPAPDCPGVKRNEQKRQMSYTEREARHFGTTPEYIEHASMGDFEDDKRRAVGAAKIFLKHHEVAWDTVVKRSLVFTGQVGRGKTHLMSAMRNYLWQQGQMSQFRKVRSMLKAVQRGYSADSELRDYEVENMLSNAPFLFIDEMETGQQSGDRTDIFEAIIDHRCRENLPTIIATNLEQDEIREVWNDRIASRLIHMAHWIELAGASKRDNSKVIK